MVGPSDVVQPPVSRAARARDAALWAVSSVGGARRCGCAASGAPEFVDGLLSVVAGVDALGAVKRELVLVAGAPRDGLEQERVVVAGVPARQHAAREPVLAAAQDRQAVRPFGVDPVGVDSQAAGIDWSMGSCQVAATSGGVL